MSGGVTSPDGPPASDHPHDPWMDARVTRLEEDVGEIKTTMRRLEPMIVRMLSDMVTKSDLVAQRAELKDNMGALREGLVNQRAELKEEMGELRTSLATQRAELKEETAALRVELKSDIAEIKVTLADKPSRTYMWGIVTAMVAAFACGLGGLAILK